MGTGAGTHGRSRRLVDVDGYFFPSADALYKNHPDLQEVERELRAQIERALKSGLKIDYVDYHMGTVMRYPEFREITERLAREFSFGMSDYFGEAKPRPAVCGGPAGQDRQPGGDGRIVSSPGSIWWSPTSGSTMRSWAHYWT